MKKFFNSRDNVPMFLPIEEIGKLLGISRSGVYQLVHQNGFPAMQLEKRLVVYTEDLFKWLEEQKTNCE